MGYDGVVTQTHLRLCLKQAQGCLCQFDSSKMQCERNRAHSRQAHKSAGHRLICFRLSYETKSVSFEFWEHRKTVNLKSLPEWKQCDFSAMEVLRTYENAII